ncbi:TOR1 phosphatidylinositol 3-kinase [Dissoconium aciculare CBS 342.82]|uniref:Serine/threonine-protein kinase TOR n=1 Tax=Dissoconium aciculare CBS 342.82 TaxID=1314786 RepID=A0A6J3M024_9PEZI|nr:TOR1 phosphatidylinositol 3-kinase [Dissoconium aciculare CBS 342.82]KAF1821278.1 TOR1 phosphatidylinositol 3-kinase [Dissoconium aciculare CBS 342.82]
MEAIFTDLKSNNDSFRRNAAGRLLSQVQAAFRELHPAEFNTFYADVNNSMVKLILNGVDTHQRTGGFYAMSALIDFKGDEAGQKVTRFCGYIRRTLEGNDTSTMVVAAKCLGKMAVPGGAWTAELVDAELKRALEWLTSERNENRRFAAVLVLKELARNSPTLLYTYIASVLASIWEGLRDQKVVIRETAAEVVFHSFQILSARDPQHRSTCLSRMLEGAQDGFKRNTVECIHGSFLAYKELLVQGGIFMHGSKYKEVCERVLVQQYREHRDPTIRRTVVDIIPLLAAYAPREFCHHYLARSMQHLQTLLKDPKQRNMAFVAIGKIAHAVGSQVAPYLDTILLHIRDALSVKNRSKQSDEAPIFECISMITIAVGQTLSKYMGALLDPIFACGLSDALTQALVDMAYYIPPVKATIQDKLLDLLSKTLCGQPFQTLGHPSSGKGLPPIYNKEWRDRRDPQNLEHKDTEIALALHTLGSFDFRGHLLNDFLRDVAIRYIEDDDAEIRRAAALTCCQLFVKDTIVHQSDHHAIQVVSDVIEKLLTVGVADPQKDIRLTVLVSLDARFDRYLAKAEHVRTLFLALNDENFPIREAAITIIGRLTAVNPAYVFPSLRKVLIQLLTEIEYSNSAQNKRESAQLISHLVKASSKLITPYVDPMVKVLLPKAADANADVAATTLRALGDLAVVGGEGMKEYIPDLMSIIIRSLQDLASPKKREAALCTLGQLATNSGYVIEPYNDHPELLTILINIVKNEAPGDLRRETIRLMGILGALDPYKHQQVIEESSETNLRAEAEAESDVTLIMRGITPSNEEYYPTVVINTLVAMLKEDTLKQFHSNVVEAIMNIYTTMGIKCVPFLGTVVPGIVGVLKDATSDNRLESYFNQLGLLVKIVRQHIRPHLHIILEAVSDHWHLGNQIQITILTLIESIAKSLEGEFKIYLANVLPLLLGVLDADTRSPEGKAVSLRVLHAFLVFGSSAEEYMHLIIPVIVRMFDSSERYRDKEVRKAAIGTIGRMSKQVNISEFAAKIIHPLARILQGTDPFLKATALETLCALIFQLGQDYLHFVPMIDKILVHQRINMTAYNLIVNKLKKHEPLPQDLSPDERYGDEDDDQYPTEIATKKLAVNQQHLKNAWEASSKLTKDDWQEWMRRFSVELLKESPQQALRACANLASIHAPLARSLFNSAFVSCWTELYDQYQEELVRAIEVALTSPNIPPEILQVLLNLAEFMEHDDKALPIDVRTLGMYAAKCHAFAKALHYKELEFTAEQNASAVEALISINNQLQQTDAAFGILRKAQGYNDVNLKETWFEKLQRWEEALVAYQAREEAEGGPQNASFEVVMGKMRCLHALGEWDTLSMIAQDQWNHASSEHKRNIAPLAAAAAWGMGQWDTMDDYLSVMKQNTPDRSFFGAILALHRNQFEDAHAHITKARDGLDTELSALLGESYARAYSVIVRVQMLAELEEIIAYKQFHNDPAKQERMRKTWTERLKGCQRNVDIWQRMLKVRALVITPQENVDMYIKFASICRKAQRTGLAEKSLNSLLGGGNGSGSLTDPQNWSLVKTAPYTVQYAVFKFLWANNQQHAALHALSEFTVRLKVAVDERWTLHEAIKNGIPDAHARLSELTHGSQMNGIHSTGPFGPQGLREVPKEERKKTDEWQMLLARCYLKQGDWQIKLHKGDWRADHVQDVLVSYSAATRHNDSWYKAWHAWALANFEVVTAASSVDPGNNSLPDYIITEHVIPAIKGFFRSIGLSKTSSLQDILRLLTLWFSHGHQPEVARTINESIKSLATETWLEVIPQLIARINQPNRIVREGVHALLIDVGRTHPQALVYPLTVSKKSDTGPRSRAAAAIMENLRSNGPILIEQADLVSHELIRIAVLWHEQWHEGLEEASRLYFGDQNIAGMMATLEPLHAMLRNGPETLREISFIQSFGRDLNEARDWCEAWKTTGEIGDLNQAWDLYYGVFKRIARQLPQLVSLELQYVSPRLKDARDLELAVPGTYQSHKPVVKIQSFEPVSSVIASKQRPRKLGLKGDDGNRYDYLLKGHEDIRQDERVMQLFGLVNTLLSTDPECFKRHLNIQRYAAIPLSTQSGLLSWVPNSDTLHVIIREYRESRKILLNIEHRIMLQMAPDYDNLTLMQKVEVFGYALDNTTGQDLYRVLWLKSKSSEAWLDRRTNYTRSLGVMSMVGYILGLGDRHPSNLMLDRITGKIIHIDFGDCFEVAMHREKYPERVPFRLTRMLTFAMEVSNIEGSFRTTCEHVMRLLRANKESLMAVLEAFIHDPLLTWRLNNRESPAETSFPSERRTSIMGPAAADAEAATGTVARRMSQAQMQQHEVEQKEVQNARALQVLDRVKEKLTGCDFKRDKELDVQSQVEKLLSEATNLENLCQHYIGWCSFW